MLGLGPRTTFNAGPGVRTGYLRGAGFLVVITLLYPIAWGVSEGGNVISPNKEMVFYGILDLVLGPIFLYYLLFSLRSVDYQSFGIHSGKYSDGPGAPTGTVNAPAGAYMTSAEAGLGTSVPQGPAVTRTGATGTGAPTV